jgi:hypothetical protein
MTRKNGAASNGLTIGKRLANVSRKALTMLLVIAAAIPPIVVATAAD